MGNKLCNQCFTKELLSPVKIFKTLKVVTINYGGVLKNPFEFYSDDLKDEISLSKTFCSLIKLYVDQKEIKSQDWDVGKIDLKIQEQRYSPLYNPKVGINDKNKFLSVQKFKTLWDQQYSEAAKGVNWQNKQPSKDQIKTMKIFDLICFHAILVHTNQISSSKKLDKIDLSKQSVSKYQKFMQKKFSKSFLDEQKKLAKVIHMLDSIDIAFVQQSTSLLIQKLKHNSKFEVREKGPGNSMIILRKDKFIDQKKSYEIKKLRKFQEKGYLNFKGNEDVVYLCINNIILISTHLASKQQKNKAEVQEMTIFLNNIKKDFPNYNVILGADANSFVSRQKFDNRFFIFPQSSSTITTRKKRTFLQPQYKKADKTIQSCKDHIITTLNIVKHQVLTIVGQNKVQDKQMFPTDHHPFDHFIVMCQLTENQHKLTKKGA